MIKVMTQACSSKTKTWFTGEWQAGLLALTDLGVLMCC